MALKASPKLGSSGSTKKPPTGSGLLQKAETVKPHQGLKYNQENPGKK